MRTWALVHDGIVTRVVESEQNPFPAGLRAVNVTGIPAQRGNSVDAVGNVGPSIGVTPDQVGPRHCAMLTGERSFRALSGVWVPPGDPKGALFATSPDALGLLAALAAAGSDHTPAADGRLVAVKASDVFDAAGHYLAACYKREADMAGDVEADTSEGWPDNGEPDEKAAPAPVAAVATRQPGTGIVPEQTPDAPHADPGFAVGGTVEAPVVLPGA